MPVGWVDTSKKNKKDQTDGTGFTSNDSQLNKLVNQRSQLANQFGFVDAAPKHGGPSIISRVFDAISRPGYASAQTVEAALQRHHGSMVDTVKHSLDLGDIKHSFGDYYAGLSGQKKTSFSNVLQTAGVKNRAVQAVGGFGLDVALDPTTYLSGGITKAATESERAAKVAQAASKAVSAVTGANTVKDAAETARRAHMLSSFLAGEKITKKGTEKIAKDAGNQVILDAAKRAGDAEKARLATEGAGKVSLKVGGTPVLESTGLYNAGQAVKGKIAGLPGIRKGVEATQPLRDEVRHLFSTASQYGPLNEDRKLFRARGVANYDDIVKRYGLDSLNLTQQEAKDFSQAYEKGTSHLLGQSKHGVDFGELTDRVKKFNHELFTEEKAAGIIPQNAPELDNYLYHVYSNSGDSATNAFKNLRKKAIASDAFKPAVERKIPDLQAAAAKGLNPEQNITAILKERAAKHAQGMARRDFVANAADQFGTQLEPKAAKLLNKNGADLVDIKKKLVDVNGGAILDYLPDHTYVHKDVANALGGVEKMFSTPNDMRNTFKLFDKVQNMWKSGVTVYSPSHHIRNLMSDVFLNALDGVVDPTAYEKAFKLIRQDSKGLVHGTTKIGEDRLSNDLIMKLFKESGASPSFIQTENLGQGLHRAATAKLHNFAENRESFGRLAHFVDSLSKEAKGVSHGGVLTPELLDSAKRAGARVRKWNVDYGDLTDFEKNAMKRVAPFYTWLRKSTPLMVEALATRPGRVAVIPKGLSALDKLLNVDPNNKLPQDMIPKWIREMGGIQAFTSGGGNPVFAAPNLPVNDLTQLGEGGVQGIMGNLAGQLTPALKIPFELATGRSTYSGAPIGSLPQYAAAQLPYSRLGGSILQNRGDAGKNDTTTRVLNFLSGLGLYEATPNRIKGELRRQMAPQQKALQNARKKYLGQ